MRRKTGKHNLILIKTAGKNRIARIVKGESKPWIRVYVLSWTTEVTIRKDYIISTKKSDLAIHILAGGS